MRSIYFEDKGFLLICVCNHIPQLHQPYLVQIFSVTYLKSSFSETNIADSNHCALSAFQLQKGIQ